MVTAALIDNLYSPEFMAPGLDKARISYSSDGGSIGDYSHLLRPSNEPVYLNKENTLQRDFKKVEPYVTGFIREHAGLTPDYREATLAAKTQPIFAQAVPYLFISDGGIQVRHVLFPTGTVAGSLYGGTSTVEMDPAVYDAEGINEEREDVIDAYVETLNAQIPIEAKAKRAWTEHKHRSRDFYRSIDPLRVLAEELFHLTQYQLGVPERAREAFGDGRKLRDYMEGAAATVADRKLGTGRKPVYEREKAAFRELERRVGTRRAFLAENLRDYEIPEELRPDRANNMN